MGLFLVFIYSLRFPSIQTYLTQKVALYLSDELNTKIDVEHVYFKPFLALELRGISFTDTHGQIILKSKKLEASLSFTRIFHNQIIIKELTSHETFFHYQIYKDSTNLDFIINHFATEAIDSPPTASSLMFQLKKVTFIDNILKLTNNNFNHHDKGVDFSDIELRNFSGVLDKIQLKSDSFNSVIKNIRFQDKSGFQVKELSSDTFISENKMEFINLQLSTNRSEIGEYIMFSYESFKDFENFMNKVNIEGVFKNSYVDSRDIEFFANNMRYVKFSVHVDQGKVLGTVSDLQATNLFLATGRQTVFDGDLRMTGLPFIERTVFNSYIRNFQTDVKDVEDIVTALRNNIPLQLPKQLKNFEEAQYTGAYYGYYNDFNVNGTVITALGELETNTSILIDKDLHYAGSISSPSFAFDQYIERKDIGSANIELLFDGRGKSLSDLNLSAQGTLRDVEFLNYTYDNIFLDIHISEQQLKMEGNVHDPNLNLTYQSEIDLENSFTAYNLETDIRYANLKHLSLIQKDSITISNTKIYTNLVGTGINNITGHLKTDSLHFSTTKGNYNIDYINFEVRGDEYMRTLNLRSDIIDASMQGQIELGTIQHYFTSLAMRYAPAIGFEVQEYHKQNFDLKVNVKYYKPISTLIAPDLALSDGTNLSAHFSSDDYRAEFEIFSPEIIYKGITLTNLKVRENADNDAFSLEIIADRLNLADSTYVNNITIHNMLSNDSLHFSIEASEPNAQNYLDLHGNIHFANNKPAYIEFTPSTILINNDEWHLNKEAQLIVSKGRFYLENLIVQQQQQQVKIDGVLSNQEEDEVNVSFTNFQLNSLNGITSPLGIHLAGQLDGNLGIKSIFKSPYISANIHTSTIVYNQLPIGKLSLLARLDPDSQFANIDLQLMDDQHRGAKFVGTYDMKNSTENINFNGKLIETDLVIFQPFLKSIVSDLSGKATADLTIQGTFGKPEVSGTGHFLNSSFVVNYLKTPYYANNQTTFVSKNAILLNEFEFTDSHGNNARANGVIDLNTPTDPDIDIDIAANNLHVLNTTFKDNNLYHGTIYATGKLTFKGPTSAMNIEINAESEENTVITIPFNSAMKVEDNEFIYFITSDTIDNGNKKASSFRGITMTLNLRLTPQADVNLQTDLGLLSGNGEGEIAMNISSLGDFEMFGDYVVNEGRFHFTAQDFINKYFNIQQGGTIRWTGNPSEAIIGLTAVYQLRTSAAPLYNAAGRSSNDQRVLAQADMILKGTLSQPDITFDLNFPQDPYIKDELQGFLSDINNVNQQALSLIVRRSFTPSSTEEFGREVNNTLLSAGTEIAFNQLNTILSQSLNIDFFDINIRSLNDASASFRFFDDRLVFTGGITDRRDLQLTDLSVFSDRVATDAELTYRLKKDGSLVLRANNRLHTRNFLLNPNDEYISAVGLVYRQDFNNLREFWRRLWMKGSKQPAYTEE